MSEHTVVAEGSVEKTEDATTAPDNAQEEHDQKAQIEEPVEEQAEESDKKPAKKSTKRRRKHTSAKKSARYGMTLRKAVPRDVLAAWKPSATRLSVEKLSANGETYATAYDLFASRAQSMAYDISTLPMTGIEVQLCADARVDNFGLFRVPGGNVVCDMYDFTHTVRGPWEWDIARLATSVELLLRARGVDAEKRRRVVEETVQEYRMAMRSFANRATMDVWYAHRDEAALAALVGKAPADGVWWLDGATEASSEDRKHVSVILDRYYTTLHPAWRRFAARCELTSVMRVRRPMHERAAWIVTLEGARPSDVVTLLVEEAQESAIQRFVGSSPQPSNAHRIADGQRAMQAMGDVLLGWATFEDADDVVRSYYVRSLWPHACDFNVTALGPRRMRAFAKACAWTIAHAHARTGNRFAIAAYLGKSDKFDIAVCDFAHMYAAQCDRDWKRLKRAAK